MARPLHDVHHPLQHAPTVQAHIAHAGNTTQIPNRTREQRVTSDGLHRDDQPLAFTIPRRGFESLPQGQAQRDSVVRGEVRKPVVGLFCQSLRRQLCFRGLHWLETSEHVCRGFGFPCSGSQPGELVLFAQGKSDE